MNYDDILILTPTKMEASLFGELPRGCRVEVCGVGMVEAAASTAGLICEKRPSIVILAGIAGACKGSALEIGDSVLVAEEMIADLGAVREEGFVRLFEKSYPCPFAHQVEGWRKAVSRSVNRCASPDCSGGEIENMEGAGFFAVCNMMGVDFLELRTISNHVGAPKSEWRIEDALEALAAALRKLINQII